VRQNPANDDVLWYALLATKLGERSPEDDCITWSDASGRIRPAEYARNIVDVVHARSREALLKDTGMTNCRNVPVVWQSPPFNPGDKLYVNAITLNLMVKVSQSVYAQTGNRTYLEHARMAHTYLRDLTYDSAVGKLVLDGFDGGGCQNTTELNGPSTAWSYNQGLIVENSISMTDFDLADDIVVGINTSMKATTTGKRSVMKTCACSPRRPNCTCAASQSGQCRIDESEFWDHCLFKGITALSLAAASSTDKLGIAQKTAVGSLLAGSAQFVNDHLSQIPQNIFYPCWEQVQNISAGDKTYMFLADYLAVLSAAHALVRGEPGNVTNQRGLTLAYV
jgi:hypothetical protein